MIDPFTNPSTQALIQLALAEDIGRGDLTTRATIPIELRGRAVLAARQALVVAGLPLIEHVYDKVAGHRGSVQVSSRVAEGSSVAGGDFLATIEGPVGLLLTGERVLLNLLQQLCGVATLTRQFVEAVAGTAAQIVDTRKTLPGMRILQKYAVRQGGGANHRFGLDDGILIKDNHIAACGSVAVVIRRARAAATHMIRVEVECDRLDQVKEALAAGADVILLDNMAAHQVRSACAEIAGRVPVEVSGGVSLNSVRSFAEAGANLISIGRLTHSAQAVDIGLDLEAAAR